MMTKVLEVAGYRHPLDHGSSFVIPVFRNDLGQLLLQKPIDLDETFEYEFTELSGTFIPERRGIAIQATCRLMKYAFHSDVKKQTFFGTKEELTPILTDLLAFYKMEPFILLELYAFLSLPVSDDLLTEAAATISRYNEIGGAQWLSVQRANLKEEGRYETLENAAPDHESAIEDLFAALKRSEVLGSPPSRRLNGFRMGSAKAVMDGGGHISFDAVLGGLQDGMTSLAAKLISTREHGFIWSIPSIELTEGKCLTSIAFVQQAGGTIIESLFRGPVQAGLNAGISRAVNDGLLDFDEDSPITLLISISFFIALIESPTAYETNPQRHLGMMVTGGAPLRQSSILDSNRSTLAGKVWDWHEFEFRLPNQFVRLPQVAFPALPSSLNEEYLSRSADFWNQLKNDPRLIVKTEEAIYAAIGMLSKGSDPFGPSGSMLEHDGITNFREH